MLGWELSEVRSQKCVFCFMENPMENPMKNGKSYGKPIVSWKILWKKPVVGWFTLWLCQNSY